MVPVSQLELYRTCGREGGNWVEIYSVGINCNCVQHFEIKTAKKGQKPLRKGQELRLKCRGSQVVESSQLPTKTTVYFIILTMSYSARAILLFLLYLSYVPCVCLLARWEDRLYMHLHCTCKPGFTHMHHYTLQTHCSTLWHCKHINHSHSIIIHKLA